MSLWVQGALCVSTIVYIVLLECYPKYTVRRVSDLERRAKLDNTHRLVVNELFSYLLYEAKGHPFTQDNSQRWIGLISEFNRRFTTDTVMFPENKGHVYIHVSRWDRQQWGKIRRSFERFAKKRAGSKGTLTRLGEAKTQDPSHTQSEDLRNVPYQVLAMQVKMQLVRSLKTDTLTLDKMLYDLLTDAVASKLLGESNAVDYLRFLADEWGKVQSDLQVSGSLKSSWPRLAPPVQLIQKPTPHSLPPFQTSYIDILKSITDGWMGPECLKVIDAKVARGIRAAMERFVEKVGALGEMVEIENTHLGLTFRQALIFKHLWNALAGQKFHDQLALPVRRLFAQNDGKRPQMSPRQFLQGLFTVESVGMIEPLAKKFIAEFPITAVSSISISLDEYALATFQTVQIVAYRFMYEEKSNRFDAFVPTLQKSLFSVWEACGERGKENVVQRALLNGYKALCSLVERYKLSKDAVHSLIAFTFRVMRDETLKRDFENFYRIPKGERKLDDMQSIILSSFKRHNNLEFREHTQFFKFLSDIGQSVLFPLSRKHREGIEEGYKTSIRPILGSFEQRIGRQLTYGHLIGIITNASRMKLETLLKMALIPDFDLARTRLSELLCVREE